MLNISLYPSQLVSFSYTGERGDAIADALRADVQANNITKTTASAHRGLAVVDNADLGASSVYGNAIHSKCVFVANVLAGDADLDGNVTLDDFNLFVDGFNTTGKDVWIYGDFDVDGYATAADFGLFSGNFYQ